MCCDVSTLNTPPPHAHRELNVSATHSIIGAIMGFSLVYGGADAVLWAQVCVWLCVFAHIHG